MKRSPVDALAPKTLTLRALAAYLQLGSVDAARRWLDAHRVPSFIDQLGYRRTWVKDVDEALIRLAAAQQERRAS